jgi:hypothetical protein
MSPEVLFCVVFIAAWFVIPALVYGLILLCQNWRVVLLLLVLVPAAFMVGHLLAAIPTGAAIIVGSLIMARSARARPPLPH